MTAVILFKTNFIVSVCMRVCVCCVPVCAAECVRRSETTCGDRTQVVRLDGKRLYPPLTIAAVVTSPTEDRRQLRSAALQDAPAPICPVEFDLCSRSQGPLGISLGRVSVGSHEALSPPSHSRPFPGGRRRERTLNRAPEFRGHHHKPSRLLTGVYNNH